MNAISTPRTTGFMPSVDCGSVGTGTDSVPLPLSPLTMTRTCHSPIVISHR